MSVVSKAYSEKEVISALNKRNSDQRIETLEKISNATIKASELVKSGKNPVPSSIISPSLLRQKKNVFGKVVNNEKMTRDEFLASYYDEFLRMYQLSAELVRSKQQPLKLKTNNKSMANCSFIEFVHEGIKNLDWRMNTELNQLLLMAKISKDNYNFSYEVARKSKEYLEDYVHMTDKKQLTAV